jgi:uncharacterized protein YegP (UPF0339 family)
LSELRFRPRPTASDDEFTFNVDPDGQVFDILFSDLQANLDEESSDMVAARVFSIVLPLDGAGDAVDITFDFSGSAFTTRGARGYAGLSVNGKTSATSFPPRTDEFDYVQRVKFETGPNFECHLSAFVLAERDSLHPGTVARLNIHSINARINRRRVGKFVLKNGSADTYHFNLMAPNGEVIATSESYKSKASAVNGIESVKHNAANAKVDDQTTN